MTHLPTHPTPRAMARREGRPPVLPLCLAVLLAACGADDAGDTLAPLVVRDSAGIEIVESRGPAWTAETSWTVSQEPEVRIGAVSASDPALELSRVSAVMRLEDGRIVVAESQAQELRWFDAEGLPLATAGGRGQGPSEFNFVGSVARLPGDTVVVQDQPRIKHVLFGPDMEFVRTEILDQDRLAETGPRAECPIMLLPDRSLVLCRPEPGGSPESEPGHFRRHTRFVRLDWSLEREDTLGLYGGLEQWGVERGDGSTVFEIHPFHARTAHVAGGDPPRVAIARNPEYSIELWSPDGRLERVLRRPGGERIASDEDREEARGLFLERMGERYEEAIRNRFLAEVEVPDTIPPIGRIALGRKGDVWARRDPQSSPEGHARYDVFDAEGRFLGPLDFPEGFQIHDVGEDWVLGVRYDEQRVPFVEMYGLDRGA